MFELSRGVNSKDKQVAVLLSVLPPLHASPLSPSLLLNFNWEASKWAPHWLRASSNKVGASVLQAIEDSSGPLLNTADQLKTWQTLSCPVVVLRINSRVSGMKIFSLLWRQSLSPDLHVEGSLSARCTRWWDVSTAFHYFRLMLRACLWLLTWNNGASQPPCFSIHGQNHIFTATCRRSVVQMLQCERPWRVWWFAHYVL